MGPGFHPWFKGDVTSGDLGTIVQAADGVLVAKHAARDCIEGRESNGDGWLYHQILKNRIFKGRGRDRFIETSQIKGFNP